LERHLITRAGHDRLRQELEHLRKVGEKAEIYNYIYVLGPRGELAGVLSLRELILAAPGTQIDQIMNSKVITVAAELDQEEAARLLAQYDLVALPVVNAGGKMAGVLTVDDVLDVIEEEATEDIHLLGGSQPLDSPYLQAGIFGVFRKRIVWLMLLFLAGTITSNILKHYEDTLTQIVALAFFIPLLIDTGGNAGAQTSTTVIRAVAVGDITVKDFFKVIWREMRLGLILGLAMAIIGLAWALAQQKNLDLGLTVSTAIIAVITVSSTIGAVMPIIGKRLGLDPAHHPAQDAGQQGAAHGFDFGQFRHDSRYKPGAARRQGPMRLFARLHPQYSVVDTRLEPIYSVMDSA